MNWRCALGLHRWQPVVLTKVWRREACDRCHRQRTLRLA